MSVRTDLRSGVFKNEVPYPDSSLPRSGRAYLDDLALWRNGEYNAMLKLRQALENEHGVIGHPKATKVWDLAWEHGHADGLGEVVTYYEEFVDLIK